ncbi:hypothetical protein R6Q59_007022, partial [Mikania micrantha]
MTKTALIIAPAPQEIIFFAIHVRHHQPRQAINSPRRAPPEPTTLIQSPSFCSRHHHHSPSIDFLAIE